MRNMNDDSGAVVRLDIALVERGVTDSRSKAQRLIESGKVRVNGTVASKASLKVTAADTLDADLGDDYVSRGAYKLVGACVGLIYIALGYGVCAIFSDLLVTPSMLALELLMGLGVGALCGAITANLRPLRRRRA